MRMWFLSDSIVYPFVLVAIVLLLSFEVYSSFNDHTYDVVITKKERTVEANEGKIRSYYLVFCKDEQGRYHEFKNEDSYLRLKFNSSRLYNQLEEGQRYKITVVGFRFTLFSWYENIIEFKKI